MADKNHRVLEQALLMLEAVADAPQGLLLSELCAKLSMSKSTVHALAHTFANMGYMLHDRQSKRFQLGIRAYETGVRFTRQYNADKAARQVLDALVENTGETVHMAILDGSDVVYIAKSECSHTIQMISQIGKRVPAHATAVGKALLAMQPDETVRALYKSALPAKLTENTLTDLDALVAQLGAIRAEGVATEYEESSVGVCCIATSTQGQLSGHRVGISISVPMARQSGGLHRFRPFLAEAATRLQVMV